MIDRDPESDALHGADPVGPAAAENARAPDLSLSDYEIGLTLIILRSSRGWNQAAFARDSGVPNHQISAYERGHKTPDLNTLLRLLKAMGYPLAAIDLTRDYLAVLRGGVGPGLVALRRTWAPPIPPPPGTGIGWEIERAAEQVGIAHASVVRVALLAIEGRATMPPVDQAEAAAAGEEGHDAAASR
jgi:DNA-binding XRE family transcriptional regulator